MTIKISQLGNLSSFADTTLFPVVDTSNAYITVKSTGTTLKNYLSTAIGNLTVSGNITANSYVNAAYFTGNGSALIGMNQYSNVQVATYLPTHSGYISGTLSTATQANVTTLGVLTTVITSGNITCAGVVFANSIATDLYNESINFVDVAVSNTYSLSTTSTNNILLITANNPTATINMPVNPIDGDVVRISANANVVLAVGTGNVQPSFAGANILVNPLQYIYSNTYARWFRI
jgi:hypothetical protein